MSSTAGQLCFDYDERTVRLALEFAILLAPHLGARPSKEVASELSTKMALLAQQRYAQAWEPAEAIRCHTCDEMTKPENRVRVAVCRRCSFEGRSVGSGG